MKISKLLLQFFFPPLCLHCQEIGKDGRLFCNGCAGYFELIDSSTRCPYCFMENEKKAPCIECVQGKRWQVRMASALDYFGPVASFVKNLKNGKLPYLAKTGAAFMVAQYVRLNWPMPDLIVPVPRKHVFQRMNHAELLAHELSRAFSAKSLNLIKRKAGDFSQAKLSKSQRENALFSSFSLKKEMELDGKVLLLVDDVLTTGTTLRRCAEVLKTTYPKHLFALTLARTPLLPLAEIREHTCN